MISELADLARRKQARRPCGCLHCASPRKKASPFFGRRDQEALADAVAAEATGRLAYAESLLAWARVAEQGNDARPAPTLGLWEHPSQLTRRIAMLLTLQPNDSRALSFAFSPDRQRLATGMDNATILVWDVSAAYRDG